MLVTEQNKLKQFEAKNRIWQGIPGIERTKSGTMFATLYSGGVAEDYGNYVILLRSTDGEKWSEPIAAAYNGEKSRCYDPCLWIDPLDRLWFIWSIMPDHAVYASICENPDDKEMVWSEEFIIGHDVMMNKPIVLSTGEWLFPIAVWDHNVVVKCATKTPEKGSFVYKTTDHGKTFVKMGCADTPMRSFDEHMILELTDGRLMMLVRTNYGIGVSYSWDQGLTWMLGVNSNLGGPCSRFFIRRLKSGKVLLINHYHYIGRNNLTALLSDDDCKTWKWHLLLDEREEVSYPDAKESEDGFIYIIYDRERGGFKKSLAESQQCAREILMAKITEEDIINGTLVNEKSKLKCVVNKLGKYEGNNPNPYDEVLQYSAEEYAQKLAGIESREEILDLLFSHYSIECQNMHKVNIQLLNKLILELQLSEFRETILIKIIALLRAEHNNGQCVEKPIVNQIISYIQDHFNEEIYLSDIAETMNISVYYMCHLFKQKTGISIVNYRNEVRLSNAKKLLIHTNEPISAISEKCGFDDANYFTKVFKKSEGIAPTEYREFNSQK